MHSNVHFALGVLLASIAHYFFPMNIWFFCIIIISSVIADIDIFLARYALQEDHRNFFSHSIYPSLILLSLGLLFGFIWRFHLIWMCGIAYGLHILLDCIDWKTRLFYGKRQFGWALLITEDEKNLGKTRKMLQLESDMDYTSFSVYRYFHNVGMLIIGITLAVLSFLVLFLLANEFWYVFLGYFGLLEIHLHQKKKMEEKYDVQNEQMGKE